MIRTSAKSTASRPNRKKACLPENPENLPGAGAEISDLYTK
jgi:hypothetical protein